MNIQQLHGLVNPVTGEMLGETGVISEDLSNVVLVGQSIQNIENWQNKFVQGLIDRIGKTVFVNRPYSGSAPSVMMDAWEFGSILMKISSDLPEATENESWELVDGASYDPFVYKANRAEAKFYNGLTTFEIDRSIEDRQLKSSFKDATMLNSFISMLFNEVEKSLTIKNDGLIMRIINSMIADTLYDLNSGGSYSGRTGQRAVNLLYMYNQKFSKSLTAAVAVTDEDFLRYASYVMSLYVGRLSKMSTLFNLGGKKRFTPPDLLHVVMLDEFQKAAGVYLYNAANNFNTDNLKFPNAETVPFWQGSGQDYAFANTSKINVTSGGGHSVEASGILCVMFDRDALGVCNVDSRVTTEHSSKAEFTNYFYKKDARYFNDANENFVVFYVA